MRLASLFAALIDLKFVVRVKGLAVVTLAFVPVEVVRSVVVGGEEEKGDEKEKDNDEKDNDETHNRMRIDADDAEGLMAPPFVVGSSRSTSEEEYTEYEYSLKDIYDQLPDADADADADKMSKLPFPLPHSDMDLEVAIHMEVIPNDVFEAPSASVIGYDDYITMWEIMTDDLAQQQNHFASFTTESMTRFFSFPPSASASASTTLNDTKTLLAYDGKIVRLAKVFGIDDGVEQDMKVEGEKEVSERAAKCLLPAHHYY